MFSIKSFKVRKSVDYPIFSKVIQSWHSPLIGTRKYEDEGYSACLTVGIAKDGVSKDNSAILLSLVNGIIVNPLTFRKHVICLADDYLNKTDTRKFGTRKVHKVIFEAKHKEYNPFIDSLAHTPKQKGYVPLEYFYPEYHGGDELNNRISLMLPKLDKFLLTKEPTGMNLRPDDAELVGIMSAYPSPESIAVTNALTQVILYLTYSGDFEDAPVPNWKTGDYFY